MSQGKEDAILNPPLHPMSSTEDETKRMNHDDKENQVVVVAVATAADDGEKHLLDGNNNDTNTKKMKKKKNMDHDNNTSNNNTNNKNHDVQKLTPMEMEIQSIRYQRLLDMIHRTLKKSRHDIDIQKVIQTCYGSSSSNSSNSRHNNMNQDHDDDNTMELDHHHHPLNKNDNDNDDTTMNMMMDSNNQVFQTMLENVLEQVNRNVLTTMIQTIQKEEKEKEHNTAETLFRLESCIRKIQYDRRMEQQHNTMDQLSAQQAIQKNKLFMVNNCHKNHNNVQQHPSQKSDVGGGNMNHNNNNNNKNQHYDDIFHSMNEIEIRKEGSRLQQIEKELQKELNLINDNYNVLQKERYHRTIQTQHLLQQITSTTTTTTTMSSDHIDTNDDSADVVGTTTGSEERTKMTTELSFSSYNNAVTNELQKAADQCSMITK